MHTSITDSVEKAPFLSERLPVLFRRFAFRESGNVHMDFFGCLSFEGIRAHNLRHVESHGVLQGLIYRLESADGVSSYVGCAACITFSTRNRR